MGFIVFIDKASAAVKTLANGLTIPISGVGYSLYFIMGIYREKSSIWDIIGMIIIVIGFVVYVLGGYKRDKERRLKYHGSK